MSPEERKEIAIYNHIWSIVDIFNEDQMCEVRSYMKSWTREIIQNEGDILVNPEGRNMIDQDDFSWFFSCSSQLDCFQPKKSDWKEEVPSGSGQSNLRMNCR